MIKLQNNIHVPKLKGAELNHMHSIKVYQFFPPLVFAQIGFVFTFGIKQPELGQGFMSFD